MSSPLSRRHVLTTAAGLAAFPASRMARAAAAASLLVSRRTIEVNRKPAAVFAIAQANGTPGVVLDPNRRFSLTLENHAGDPTIIHWHGQTPPPDQDGVVDTDYVSLIPPDGSQTYDFAPRGGTHWMHSHHGLQEQLLMAAPLVVHTADDMHADWQEAIVLLHDFTFRDPAEVLAGLGGSAMTMSSAPSAMHSMPMNMSGGNMSMSGGAMDLNDVDYDAYLANDRTLGDPQVVRVEHGGRVRLRLINGATSTAFWIDLGRLNGTVVAVDGDPVRPVTGRVFPIAQGQRLDILARLPAESGSFPVLAQREGDRQRTGIILASAGASIVKVADVADAAAPPVDLSLERRLTAANPLRVRKADVTHRVTLTGTMQPYVWSINGRTWTDHQPLRVKRGQRVSLEFVNDSPMAHPMHLHGHHFQVAALNGKPLQGAMRDTVLVPAEAAVTVAFDADNPGRWLLHCHNLFHMATGMMTELAYDA